MLTIEMLRRAVEAQETATAKLEVERALLLGAWQAVRPAKDWKGPISKTIDPELCDYSAEVIVRAVGYFTGTEATALPVPVGGRVHFIVQSVGYRAGPCGP